MADNLATILVIIVFSIVLCIELLKRMPKDNKKKIYLHDYSTAEIIAKRNNKYR